MDAKDILIGLPKAANTTQQGGVGGGGDKKSSSSSSSKPHNTRDSHHHHHHHRKPDGVSREVYALTGGLAMPPSMMPSSVDHRSTNTTPHLTTNLPQKVTWQWLPFANSARNDNLQLFHWVRVVNGVPPTGDYSFAKYNKPVDIVKYTDEEYEKHLTDPVWTKEETDQLFELCEQFHLRFIVVADRFPSSRSIEELKDRYYSAARAILIARASSPNVLSGHPLVKEPYNVSHEKERKRALSMVLSQTKHQERKDVEVLAEAKRISKSRMSARAAEEVEFPAMINIIPDNTERDIVPLDTGSPSANAQLASTSTAAESASVAATLRTLRVYTRTYALDQMVQAVSTSAGLRTIKRVEETLQELGVNLKPKVPTKAVCAEHLELRKEILTLLNLQKQLQYKEAEGSSYRDGSFSETPSTKRLQRGVDQDSSFVLEPLSFGGDRVGKRDQKRKAPGKSEAPSTAAHKRPRKLKASD